MARAGDRSTTMSSTVSGPVLPVSHWREEDDGSEIACILPAYVRAKREGWERQLKADLNADFNANARNFNTNECDSNAN